MFAFCIHWLNSIDYQRAGRDCYSFMGTDCEARKVFKKAASERKYFENAIFDCSPLNSM